MTADVFVDTNILLYTVDEDPASTFKHRRAQEVLLFERLGLVGPSSGGILRQCHVSEATFQAPDRRSGGAGGGMVRISDDRSHAGPVSLRRGAA